MRGERRYFHDPEATIERMGLRPGHVVADVGSAAGFYTLPLVSRVAPNGFVLAVDVQPEMLGHLRSEARARGIENVLPVLGAFDDPHLPAWVQ
jgi:ubiquinone/menaquinone biosynthesis C-methylase UbiE